MQDRNFDALMADVMGLIPPSELALIARIKVILRGYRYRAPELRHLDLQSVEKALEEHAGGNSEWERKLQKLWNGGARA